MIDQSQKDLHDDVSRALGILSTAKKISSEETMHYLSKVRMGVNLGLIDDVKVCTINKLFIHTQPAHLQKLHGRLLGVIRSQYRTRDLSSAPSDRPAWQRRTELSNSLAFPLRCSLGDRDDLSFWQFANVVSKIEIAISPIFGE